MRLRSLASLRPWLYPYNIEIIYIPISIIYYLVSYCGSVFLCINLLLTFTVIQPAAAKVINKQINQSINILFSQGTVNKQTDGNNTHFFSTVAFNSVSTIMASS